MELYCVLWMPTVIHKDFEFSRPEGKRSEVFEISDEISYLAVDDKKIYCQLILDQNKDICISVYEDKEAHHQIEELSFQMEYVMHSHNGLFKYNIEIEDETGNPLLKRSDETLDFPCDIYNKVKEFYHKHNFHKVDDGDSMIKPYISAVDINIQESDNDALKHYLSQYENKFRTSLKFINMQYDSLVERGWWKNFAMLMLMQGKHHTFYKLATRVKGDKAYYNSLLHSCYNTIADLSPLPNAEANEESKEARRRIFNVVNCIECLNVMEERINNRFNIQTSVISFWVAIIAIVLSVVFYLFSTDHSDSINTILMLLMNIWEKFQ